MMFYFVVLPFTCVLLHYQGAWVMFNGLLWCMMVKQVRKCLDKLPVIMWQSWWLIVEYFMQMYPSPIHWSQWFHQNELISQQNFTVLKAVVNMVYSFLQKLFADWQNQPDTSRNCFKFKDSNAQKSCDMDLMDNQHKAQTCLPTQLVFDVLHQTKV